MLISNSVLKAAIGQAQKSNFHHRHGCVIFKNNKIVSVGYNEMRYCKKLDKRYRKWINSLHAEQKTILFTQKNLKRCSILVVRINKEDKLIYSKPCKLCQCLISDSGIGKIYYADKDGEIKLLEAN